VDAPTHHPSESSPVAQSWGRAAAGLLLRVAKLVAAAVLGMALLIFGLVWLIEGISDRRPISAAAGGLALAALVITCVYVMLRSRQAAKADLAASQAKLRAGLRTCWSCRMDFEEAAAPRTPKPWHHTAAAVAVALPLIAAGALGIWALGLSSFDSFKAAIILLAGVGVLGYAIKSSRNFYVRCPKCGRACGSVEDAPRGFPVELVRTGGGQGPPSTGPAAPES